MPLGQNIVYVNESVHFSFPAGLLRPSDFFTNNNKRNVSKHKPKNVVFVYTRIYMKKKKF